MLGSDNQKRGSGQLHQIEQEAGTNRNVPGSKKKQRQAKVLEYIPVRTAEISAA